MTKTCKLATLALCLGTFGCCDATVTGSEGTPTRRDTTTPEELLSQVSGSGVVESGEVDSDFCLQVQAACSEPRFSPTEECGQLRDICANSGENPDRGPPDGHVSDSQQVTTDAGTRPPQDAAADARAPEPDLNECLTDGSGGIAADVENQSFSSGSQSSQYHLYASGYTGAPTGLLVFFHGNGAEEFYDPSGENLDDVVREAKSRGFITLAVLSPGSYKSWCSSESTGVCNKSIEYEPYAAAIIEEIAFKRFNIDRRRILVVGYSGGSDFIASTFIPKEWENICHGAALLLGGGESPSSSLQATEFSQTFIDNFKFVFYTGQDDDFTLDYIGGAINFYTRNGFTVYEEHPSGIDHYNIPWGEVVAEQLDNGLID